MDTGTSFNLNIVAMKPEYKLAILEDSWTHCLILMITTM